MEAELPLVPMWLCGSYEILAAKSHAWLGSVLAFARAISFLFFD